MSILTKKPEKFIDTDDVTLEEYLQINEDNNVEYVIPFSQREYEWGNDEVNRLFDDFISVYQNDSQHILNFFTLSGSDFEVDEEEEDNKLFIFDGQQRTVTSLLILAVFIQILYKYDNNKLQADKLYSKYVKNEGLYSDEEIYKLSFDSEIDNEVFRKLIDKNFKFESISELDNKDSETSKNLINNYKTIYKRVSKFLESKDNDGNVLVDVIRKITQKNKLIILVTKNDDIARDMFESLNNTGKSLAKYYVLKNDLVISIVDEPTKESKTDSEKEKDEKYVRSKWNIIDSNLFGLNRDTYLKSVAKLFKKMIKGEKSKNVLDDLYSKFDSKGHDDMKSLLDVLEETSELYKAIQKPEKIEKKHVNTDNFRNDDLEKLKSIVKDIKMFGFTQYSPLLLALLYKKSMDLVSINEILEEVLSLAIRNFYIASRRGSTVEDNFSTFTYKVYTGSITVEELKEDIKKLMIPDEELKVIIKNKIFVKNNNRKNAYILAKVFNDDESNVGYDVNYKKNDLEHILPVNPKSNSAWSESFKNENNIEKLKWNIGNMTLLHKDKNLQAGNKDFKEKKEIYRDLARIGFADYKSLVKIDKWDRQSIMDRSDVIADKVCKTFS